MIINNKIQLMTYLRNLNLGQRQDSLKEQAYDMVVVFESFGMLAQAQETCRRFHVSDNSTRYSDIVTKVKVKCDLEEQDLNQTKQLAVNISNLFGCYDFADSIK